MSTGIHVSGVVHGNVFGFRYVLILSTFLNLIEHDCVMFSLVSFLDGKYKLKIVQKMRSSVICVMLAQSINWFSSSPAIAVRIDVCAGNFGGRCFSLFSR